MIFWQNLLKARHHLVFLAGLACASYIVYVIETQQAEDEKFRSSLLEVETPADFEIAKSRPLTDAELEWAKVAWTYFENNYIEATGLVNSVDGYPAATLWDTASYLMGLISAHRLEIVEKPEFDRRVSTLLDSFYEMQLFENKLPNKSYNTHTLDMVDYDNQPTTRGIGWSAIDIGRILVPLNILVWQYPDHTDAVTAVLGKWQFNALLDNGVLVGAAVDAEDQTDYVQEGRIGYEEYAAKTLSIMGYDVSRALRYVDYLEYYDIYGLDIPTDLRDPEIYEAHNYVVSESYILDGLEFGWDRVSKEFARRVYLAQEMRFEDTGQLTAVSEDNIDQAPYFVYNTVFTSGKEWNTITETGDDASEFRSISTKAAFGWHALYANEYTDSLVEKVGELNDPEKGFYSGWYEGLNRTNKALTANTNGIILESLAYRAFGPLLRVGAPEAISETVPAVTPDLVPEVLPEATPELTTEAPPTAKPKDIAQQLREPAQNGA